MNHKESNEHLEAKKLSIKHALLLFATWFFISALLLFSRITHPAFGIQGDLPLHYHITRSFERSFSEGEVFPRWAGLLDGGRGDAFFTFYPPLSYLLSTMLIKLLGVGALTALKIGSLLILIIAQINAYLFARQFFSRRSSLIASLTWVLLPAYPLIALHRGFFANALGLSIVPLALLGAHLLLVGEKYARGFVIFALSFSAIVLSHTITTYLSAITIGLLTLIYLPKFGWRAVARLAGAGIVTLTLTLFFLWPQRVEASWVRIGLQTIQQDYHNYFLFAKSHNASKYSKDWADVNYVASIITVMQTLMAILLGLMCRKILSLKKPYTPLTSVAWFGVVTAVFGLFISAPISELFWRYTPGFKYIQFPWRFQPFVALGCSLLTATAWELWPTLNPKSRMRIAAALTWIVIVNAIFTFMLARLDEPNVTRAQAIGLLDAPNAKPVKLDEGRELLREEDLNYASYSANQLFFRPLGSDRTLYPLVDQPGNLSFIAGHCQVQARKLQIAHREFLIEGEEPARARIETYNYPHWVARLDGQEIKIGAEQGSGLMLLDIPAGKHRLTLDYEVRQPSQRIARGISAVAWAGFLIWALSLATQRSRRKRISAQ